ncbi:MAG: hypothetical protein JO254_17270 [Pseudolabrys sp.]|nr:hypothetical protein [Pseudolabrys sp.]
MLRAYRIKTGELEEIKGDINAAALRRAQWVDLCTPSEKECALVTKTLGISLAAVNEAEPYQVSSYFRSEKQQLTMTGLLVTLKNETDPHLLKITFVRAKNVLVTVSDHGTDGLTPLVKECENCFTHHSSRDDIFAALLDMLVDHTDNILDKVGNDLACINDAVFQHHVSKNVRRRLRSSPRKRNRQLEHILTQLGESQEVLVKLRRSVLSFRRMIAFLREQDRTKELIAKLQTFEHDLKSIDEAEVDLSQTANFLLDGVNGYIGLLQNKVMNILTFVTLLLTPAMVVGGIYGMNFKIMPELQWTYGYPYALGLIVVSTIGLYIWMRLRGI